MAAGDSVKVHEQTFCADVASWANDLFARHSDWPFTEAKVEQFVAGSRKRSDLRIFRKNSATPVLCGEVKLPGTPEGRTPYDHSLVLDASNKADRVQAKFFFTWNVKSLVLWDRSLWNVPMPDRRVEQWDIDPTLAVSKPEHCGRPEVATHIREVFLPAIFEKFAAIVDGRVTKWGLPPDLQFLRSLESHLDWPVIYTRDYLAAKSAADASFRARLQSWMVGEMNWTFNPQDDDDWQSVLERASRTLCYVFSNRAIFYEAIRARFPNDLDPLSMPSNSRGGPETTYRQFQRHFAAATRVTGDYEPIFYPEVADWAGALVFAEPSARQGWAGLLKGLESYNFSQIPRDIVGGIFQRLIAPEERQKFGQFFTNEDIIDIINAFCIRNAADLVCDPACGSGSFLVRAYHRKAWLSEHKGGGRKEKNRFKSHDELLSEIFGCEIAVFPAHLATLNLAARSMQDEENYPRIARRNFFEVPDSRSEFTCVPGLRDKAGNRERLPVPLPELDAIVGNPPYVRQENIQKAADVKRMTGEPHAEHVRRLKNTKDYIQDLCERLWPGIGLSGRSDLHCYFWPAVAKGLKTGGYFGFLTSSSWLDVEYGFPLQRWVLQNFKLVAVIESLDEPWFQDARVKTAVTILQRCDDPAERHANTVRFVRLQKPVREILDLHGQDDEGDRQAAAERFRKLILNTTAQYETDLLRIIPVPQKQLWDEGVSAARLLDGAQTDEAPSEDDEEDQNKAPPEVQSQLSIHSSDYAAGKWGRFIRAPDIYFKLLRDHGNRFVRLGEIAEVRFGLKSGCDAFFMPRDVTDEVLSEIADGLPWNDLPLLASCKLKEVESGTVRIIRAGDNTLHPVETRYLRPEVHSLMQVDRPVVRATDTDRVVLWVGEELRDIGGTYAAKYIRWGAKQTFTSKKSKAVPVPERSTCAARPRWFDLTTDAVGAAFWPMAQQYRHIIASNPEGLVCNHNLFLLRPRQLSPTEAQAFTALLNSTLVGILKHFYGRYAGTEANLKTEVVDVTLLEVPDPRGVEKALLAEAIDALDTMSERPVTHLVGKSLLECRTIDHLRSLLLSPAEMPDELLKQDRQQLDDATLRILGVHDSKRRAALLGQLYQETAQYYRYQRTLEIQGMVNRGKAGRSKFTPQDLAAGIWDSLSTDDRAEPLAKWLVGLSKDTVEVDIPEGEARALGHADMFRATAVVFETASASATVDYPSADHAALVAELAGIGTRGPVKLPSDPGACANALSELRKRIAAARVQFHELASKSTGTDALRDKIADQLMHWFVHGR